MDPQNSSEDEVCYEIQHSEELGRYLVAKRDLEPLEVVIRDKPLVCAPADDPNFEGMGNIHMCLGCFARLPSNSKSSSCSKCLWPVCDADCESISHHSSNECPLFQENNVSFKNLPYKHLLNETIFIIRSLFLKHNNPTVWTEIVLKFEHHTAVRMSKPECVEKDRKIMENLAEIHKHCSASNSNNWFHPEKDTVVLISGIINVNAFSSTKLEDECRSRRVRKRLTICQCLYPTSTLLAHQCIPNASWTISASPHFEQTIRTTVPIKKGEMICIAYATQEIMWATLQRLISTEEVAHFICKCYRCQDPTELGTFIGAVKCTECQYEENGYLLPKEPTNPESIWACQECATVKSVQQVVKIVHKIERKFERIKNSAYSTETEIAELEELYEESRENFLHKNHFLLHEISLRIVNKNAFSLYYLDDDDIERFLFHCFSILKLSDILSPGYCRPRAIIQFYTSQALMVKARKQVSKVKDISKTRLVEIYKPIYKFQKDSYLYFKTEDENDNRYRKVKGFNQYVACLIEEMEECLKCMQL